MTSAIEVLERTPSMVDWLDDVRMSAPEREIAKAYVRKSEALLDAIWSGAARVQAAFGRRPKSRRKTGSSLAARNA